MTVTGLPASVLGAYPGGVRHGFEGSFVSQQSDGKHGCPRPSKIRFVMSFKIRSFLGRSDLAGWHKDEAGTVCVEKRFASDTAPVPFWFGSNNGCGRRDS